MAAHALCRALSRRGRRRVLSEINVRGWLRINRDLSACMQWHVGCTARRGLSVGALPFQLAPNHIGELCWTQLVQLGGDPGQPARAEGRTLVEQTLRFADGTRSVVSMVVLSTQ